MALNRGKDRNRAMKALGKLLPPKALVHHFSETELVICQNRVYHRYIHQRQREKGYENKLPPKDSRKRAWIAPDIYDKIRRKQLSMKRKRGGGVSFSDALRELLRRPAKAERLPLIVERKEKGR